MNSLSAMNETSANNTVAPRDPRRSAARMTPHMIHQDLIRAFRFVNAARCAWAGVRRFSS